MARRVELSPFPALNRLRLSGWGRHGHTHCWPRCRHGRGLVEDVKGIGDRSSESIQIGSGIIHAFTLVETL